MSLSLRRAWCFARALTLRFGHAPIISAERAYHVDLDCVLTQVSRHIRFWCLAGTSDLRFDQASTTSAEKAYPVYV